MKYYFYVEYDRILNGQSTPKQAVASSIYKKESTVKEMFKECFSCDGRGHCEFTSITRVPYIEL